jgi:endoglucanase
MVEAASAPLVATHTSIAREPFMPYDNHPAPISWSSTHEMNRRLGRGINLGNALDAPAGQAPRLRLEQRTFDLVATAGFDTVRLPVRWSAHADPDPPYAIAPEILARVDWALDTAAVRGLNMVLNIHHYDRLYDDPERHTEQFLALWEQIASRYADRGDRLVLELLNEPRRPMTPRQWNDLLARALAVVRAADPGRTVVAGPAEAGTIDGLAGLILPDDDNLIVTVHYYLPMAFTHQDAWWVPDSGSWHGRSWGDESDHEAVRHDLDIAAAWAAARGRPLFVGEFGAHDTADMESRARWTAAVRVEAERVGASWAYWDFATDFGAYDPRADAWHEPLRRALLGPAPEGTQERVR